MIEAGDRMILHLHNLRMWFYNKDGNRKEWHTGEEYIDLDKKTVGFTKEAVVEMFKLMTGVAAFSAGMSHEIVVQNASKIEILFQEDENNKDQ